MFNETEVRKTIALMKPDNELFEVRIIHNSGKKNYSGYFTDADKLISALKRVNLSDCNAYMTLNPLNPACIARTQKDKFEQNPKTTTGDADVLGWNWLFIDLDPKRPAGTSSSNEQLEKAKELGNKVFQFMKNLGFNKPLMALSGNGVHLLYKIYLKNDRENTEFIKKCLKTLDMLFSTEEIEIDLKTFNPARVCKLYGTLAQKGANHPDFPHRMSCILGNPAKVEVNKIDYLKKLCSLYPEEEEKPSKYNNYSPRDFDLDDWLIKNGLNYKKTSWSNGTKYILDCCPFDSNHKGKDACIFQSGNGAIGFHCFHNSCSDKTWRDVRIMFEPDAYEKKYQAYDKQIHNQKNSEKPREQSKPIVAKDGKPVFYTAMDIFNLPYVEEQFIKSGTTMLDKRLRGLKKGFVSVVSGMRASAKSTLLSEWALNAVNDGYKVAVYSGELTEKNFMKWMNLQAAGKQYVTQTQYENYYTVEKKYQKMIATWLGDKFYLYNNNYGNDFNAIKDQFEKVISEKKIDLLILDNLMSFNIAPLANDKYEAQTKFVLRLTEIAKKHDIHICFVAHPRKAITFLRLEDISGTMDLGNAVDYAFIVHRNNHDFENRYKSEFGNKKYDDIADSTNVIEIAKDRDGGVQDEFIPLWYEVESKRLKNEPAENKIYGWMEVKQESGTQEDNKQIEDKDDDWVDMDINFENPFE